jgi:hypothetical protein
MPADKPRFLAAARKLSILADELHRSHDRSMRQVADCFESTARRLRESHERLRSSAEALRHTPHRP